MSRVRLTLYTELLQKPALFMMKVLTKIKDTALMFSLKDKKAVFTLSMPRNLSKKERLITVSAIRKDLRL